jgi:hypothetical protein
MDDLKKNVDNFIDSIENNSDINVIQNNLSLLIAKINIFYYKYNILNNKSCSSETIINLNDLDNISKKIRNIYPKFVELRKAHFKKIFIDKLQCDRNPTVLIDNITRSNKVQKMISDLTELLYVDSNSILNKNSNNNMNNMNRVKYKKSKFSLIFFITFCSLIILGIIIFFAYKYYEHRKKNKTTAVSEVSDSA